MINKGYSLRQAAKLSGVPTMTFHAWKEKGLVTPDVADDKGNISLFSEMMIDRAKEIDKQRKAKKSANNSGNLFENTAFVESVEKGEDLPNDEATSAGLPRQSKAIIEQPDPDRDVDSGNSPTKTFAENASEGTAAPMSDEQNERINSDASKNSGDNGDGEANHREKEKAVNTSETPITIDLAPASDVVTLEERADRIRQLQADVQRGIIDIGFELIAAKKEIGHGQWQNWLATEFDWTDRTARNFMAIAERYGNRKTFSDLKPATLIKMLALPEGDEQNFIDAQTAAGRPIETQSAREVQRNVKAWKEQHAPADDDSSENLSSFEGTEKHGKIAAVVTPCVEEESISEDTPPASSAMIESSYNIAADFIIFSEKDIEYIRTVTIELANKGDLKTLKWWHDRLLGFAQEIGEQVLLAETKCGELINDSAGGDDGSKPL